MTEKFVVGVIGAPFGLKGFVKVKPLSGEIEHLLKFRQITVRHNGEEKLLRIEESAGIGANAAGNSAPGNKASASAAVIMRFSGIASPESARSLNGAELLADRKHACPLHDGEFYVEDIKGLAALAGPGEQLPEGKLIGRITNIVEGGGGSLAELELKTGEKKLVPFRNEFFTDISPQDGHVTLKNLWVLE